jgi:hypothetical protein
MACRFRRPVHAAKPTRRSPGRAELHACRQYLLVDVDEGSVEPLIEAPAADFMRGLEGGYQVRWSGDGKKVAVSGTYLPLSNRPTRSHPLRPCLLAVVSIAEHSTQCVVEANVDDVPAVTSLDWGERNSRLSAAFAGLVIT